MNRRAAVSLYSLFAFAAYAASLLWAFPKEFHPLIPYRADLYAPVALLGEPLSEVLLYPRPVVYLLQRVSGLLGIHGAIAASIAVVLVSAVLTPLAISRCCGIKVNPIAFLTFLTLVFTQSEFYFQHRFDVFSVVAWFFLLLAILAADRWLRERRWRNLALALALLLAMALSKETYALSALALLATLCICEWRLREWRPAALLLGGACLMEAAGEGFNMVRFLHYAGTVSASSPYAPDLHPASILAGVVHYLEALLPLTQLSVLILAVLLAILAFWKQRRTLLLALTFVLAGVLALVPNALLPHHDEIQYAWNAAPLLFAVVLFVPGGRWQGVLSQSMLLAIAVFSVHTNAQVYNSIPHQWVLNEEHVSDRIDRALPVVRQAIRGPHRAIVTGFRSAYHPWQYPGFIRTYFGGDVQWVNIVPRDKPESTDRTVRLARAGEIQPESFDALAEFKEDGSLVRVLTGAAYRDAVRSDPDSVLVPELARQERILVSKPADFATLLAAGAQALTWGLPERAVPYLRRAAEAGPSNPYPWFFMGQSFQDQHNVQLARIAYQKAIALDDPNGNPAFRQALAALPPSE